MKNLSALVKTAQKLATDNAPVILTGVGVAGTVATAVLAGKASYKANDILRLQRIERDNEQLKNVPVGKANEVEYPSIRGFEAAKIVWKLYIPAAGVGIGTITAIVFANRINTKRLATLAAAYSLSERAHAEYKEKVKEVLGKGKEEKVRDEVAADRVHRDLEKHGIVALGIPGPGQVWLHDAYSGRPVLGTVEGVRKAVNDINRNIQNEDSQTVSDFYDMIGLPHTSVSDEFGWNNAEPLVISWTTVSTGEGLPAAHSFDFETRPVLRPWRNVSFR